MLQASGGQNNYLGCWSNKLLAIIYWWAAQERSTRERTARFRRWRSLSASCTRTKENLNLRTTHLVFQIHQISYDTPCWLLKHEKTLKHYAFKQIQPNVALNLPTFIYLELGLENRNSILLASFHSLRALLLLSNTVESAINRSTQS
jgi:hypothetical protein